MAFPFGPQTIGALIKALAEGNSHSQLGTLFLGLGVDRWDREGERVNKEVRVQGVIKGLRSEDGSAAERAALELAREAVVAGAGGPARWWPALIDALAADGFEYDGRNECLVPAVPGVSVARERSLLERDLRELGWDDAAAHYRQAADNVSSGDWESANGQGRSFLEDLIPRVAAGLGKGRAPGKPQAALQYMRDKKLLHDGEFDFARGLWEMCNSRGSHAGRSNPDEARFRLLTVTAYGRFLLSRRP